MRITEKTQQIRGTRILYKGRMGVILRARVGKKTTPIMAEIRFQFGDRETHDISPAVWDEKTKTWIVA